MLVRDVHPQKATFPISLTLSGISMVISSVHPSKAPPSIFVTLFGIIDLTHPVISRFPSLSRRQLPSALNDGLEGDTVILVSPAQPEKADEPMEVISLWMSNVVRLLQPWKVLDSIEVTELGMEISVRLEQ